MPERKERSYCLIAGRLDIGVFHAGEIEAAYPAADLITYRRAVFLKAATDHDRFAGAFGRSGAVVVDAAGADIGYISDENTILTRG